MKPASSQDTIVAISTAPGEGGIGIVRLSGDSALAVADRIFLSKSGVKPSAQKPYTAQYGFVMEPGADGRRIDEALLLTMRAPKSYTRQDMVEVQCHGGRAVMQKVLELCLSSGARAAEPGEFTKRAFLNGRLDLAQAEAVLDLIRAKTDRARDAAQSQLRGDVSRLACEVRDELAEVLAHTEAAIDFPDDRIDPMDAQRLAERLRQVDARLEELLKCSRSGILVRDGLSTVLAGRPNVGKSSLMNALVRSDRVIVSPRPGTTRDTVAEEVQIGGCAVRLVDTAGLQEGSCEIEREGIERSHAEIARCDLVLFVVDGSVRPEADDRALWEALPAKDRFLIINKADRAPSGHPEAYRRMHPDGVTVLTSCTAGTGLEELENRISQYILKDAPERTDQAWAFSVRHVELFRRAQGHVRQAAEAYAGGLSGEFPAQDLRLALEALGEIVGEVVTEDILGLIFSKFCIGK